MINRNLFFILLANIVLGAPMPMLIILGSLVGAHLAPVSSLITVPISAQLLAGIVIATPLSLFMGYAGRRVGFLVAGMLTIVGGLMAVVALKSTSFWLLCVAHFVMGSALVGVNYLRFAAGEVVSEKAKPNAISFTLASGIVAALFGPSLFEFSKDWLYPLPFAGAYATIALLGLLGMIPVLMLSLPKITAGKVDSGRDKRALVQHLVTRPQIRLAIVIAAVAQGLMVLMMVPTPQAMVEHGFHHGHAADVIRWHVVAMFAPGLVTGMLINRFGLIKIISTGLVLLLAAGVAGALETSLAGFYIALILLGAGWNFAFIGSTHLLQKSASTAERSAIQGINDTAIAIASVGASVLSGVLYVGVGWVASSSIIIPIIVMVLLWLFFELRKIKK